MFLMKVPANSVTMCSTRGCLLLVIYGFVVTPLNHFLAASCTFLADIMDLPSDPGGVPGRAQRGAVKKERAQARATLYKPQAYTLPATAPV